MGSYVIKVEYNDSEKLSTFIEESYYVNDSMGKLSNKELLLDVSKDNEMYSSMLKMDKEFIKIWNESVIDGVATFIVNVINGDVFLKAVDFYSLKINDKFTFY